MNDQKLIKPARAEPGSRRRISDWRPVARTQGRWAVQSRRASRCPAPRALPPRSAPVLSPAAPAVAACQSRLFWGAMATLDERLDRVFDPKTAKVLTGGLDLHTVGDLLRHYPRRYERHGELTDLASLRDGEQVTVLAQIAAVTTRRMKSN